MVKSVSAQVLVRRDTANNWANTNPILKQGQIGFNTTNGKHKIGDGETPWNKLPYFILDNEVDVNKTLYGIVDDDGKVSQIAAGGSGFRATGNISDLTNDVGYQTQAQVQALIKKAIKNYGIVVSSDEPQSSNRAKVWAVVVES